MEESSRRRGDENVNLALLTDGLKAEREQGITIDVAYRYFATPRRKFIIADTPGHIQYTRNMVTGASTANLAIILIDARKGVIEQTKRHAFIANLLRIQHLVIAVNKMDLVDYSEEVYNRIIGDFREFASRLDNIVEITDIPISALNGDNVVDKSANMPVVPGPHPALSPRTRLCRRRGKPCRCPLPGPVGHPPDERRMARLPRLRRTRRRRRVQTRRRGHRAALRFHHPHQGHPQPGRRTAGSLRPAIRLPHPHRRDRHLARRHAGQSQQPAAGQPGHRGDDLLVLAAPDAAAAPSSSSATPPAKPRPSSRK